MLNNCVAFQGLKIPSSEQTESMRMLSIDLIERVDDGDDAIMTDTFDLDLATNDEVLELNQDPLCRQAYLLANEAVICGVLTKEALHGSKAFLFFALIGRALTLSAASPQFGRSGRLGGFWRQDEVALGGKASPASAFMV